MLGFLASQAGCVAVMEACGSAHYWGRDIMTLGREVRLVPPIYEKPFVKRQKTEAADAISEAAQRPTMRFMTVKTEAPSQIGCAVLPASGRGQAVRCAETRASIDSATMSQVRDLAE